MPLVTIQYARAVAALMVVVFHLKPQLQRMGAELDAWPHWLASGVDVFFVISGFIMWWTTRDAVVSPGDFVRRRIERIVPLYWIITTFYVLVLLVAPRLMQTGALDWPHVLSSYLFLPYPHPVVDLMHPLVTPGWTLNYEMFFYVIFAAALFAPREIRLPLIAVTLVGLVVAGVALQPQNRFLGVYTSSLLLEFLLGVVVAELVLRRVLIPAAAALPAAVVAFACIPALGGFADDEMRGFVWGPPAAVFVFAIVSLELGGRAFRSATLLLLGDASYSIYLSHQLTLSAAGQAWRRAFDDASAAGRAGFCLAAMLAAVIVGLACYRFVERPANRLARRLLGRGRTGDRAGGRTGDRPAEAVVNR